MVRELEEDAGKTRVRGLYIVKSRGMGHSSDVHKLILSDDGIALVAMDASQGSPKGKAKGKSSGGSESQKMRHKVSPGDRGLGLGI